MSPVVDTDFASTTLATSAFAPSVRANATTPAIFALGLAPSVRANATAPAIFALGLTNFMFADTDALTRNAQPLSFAMLTQACFFFADICVNFFNCKNVYKL